MKYTCVFFDWGDTLSPLNAQNIPILNDWAGDMLRKLYLHSYRLAIISNTHRYQDANWIRRRLEEQSLLALFEVVISSATYAVHKPNLALFHKALDFMQVDPEKVIMVGDSAHADGACQLLGMGYLCVTPGEKWHDRLYNRLGEDWMTRKLTPIFEYGLKGDSLIVKLRHLSEPLVAGDRFLVGDELHEVVACPPMTKEKILAAKEDFIKIQVRPVG